MTDEKISLASRTESTITGYSRSSLITWRALKAVKWMALLFLISIQIQVFLAGMALFTEASYWAVHANLAHYISLIPLLMLVASFLAKIPYFIRVQIIALIVMIVLMFLTAVFATEIQFLSALHPVIAVALFYRTMTIFRDTSALLKKDNQAVENGSSDR